MVNWAEAWIRGDIEWDSLHNNFRQWAPALSGAVFGAGWWCFVDAFVVSKAVQHESVPATFFLPGIVATIALVLMNLVPRDSLNDGGTFSYTDEDHESKARCWLFMSYMVAFGAVAGAVAVFISTVQHHQHTAMGVGCLLQSGFILASALLFWAFRTPSEGSSYMMY